jgi:hypothetical protein
VNEDLSTRIHEGMKVEDADGDKVGTVGMVFQPVSTPSTTANWSEPATAYLKVDAGLFGLTKHWYTPASAIREVVDDRVILSVDESRLGDMGWSERPDWINE